MLRERFVVGYALVLIFMLVVNYVIAEEQIDCRQRPKKLIKTSTYCCETPKRNLEDFEDLCFKQTQNNTLRCQLDCLFQVTNALEHETLNLAKLHKMLEKVFPNASEFVAAFYISFEECIPLVKNILAEKKKHENIKAHCEPVAIFYAACAQIKLLKNCPQQAWNGTTGCENARNFVTKCETNLLPQHRKSRTNQQYRIEATKKLNESSETESNNTMVN